MIENENFVCFPRYDLLSRCFHFGFFEIFVPNLFPPPFLSFRYSCVSTSYKQPADFQEEDNDDIGECVFLIAADYALHLLLAI